MKDFLKNNFYLTFKFLQFFYHKFFFVKLKFFSGTKKQIFTNIHKKSKWIDSESRSGSGSNLEQTKKIRNDLPRLFKELKINSVIDCPCGDFNWMRTINLDGYSYKGYDIVSEIISINNKKYGKENISFEFVDVTNQILEKGDLIIMRDLLVHFSYKDINKTITNIAKSSSIFLLTTNFSKIKLNHDIATGQWRPINLMLPPFNFPKPKFIINELNTEYNNEALKSKNLSLWEINDLKI